MKPGTVCRDVDRLKNEMEATKKEIAELFGFNDEDMFDMVSKSGWTYLALYFLNTPVMAQMAEKSDLFWKWYRLNWYHRDRKFLDDPERPFWSPGMQLQVYLALHNPYILKDSLKMERLVYVRLLPTLKCVS